MARDKNQLQIFAPGAEDPNKAFLEAMGITTLICAVMAAVGIQYAFYPTGDAAKKPAPTRTDGKTPLTEAEKISHNLQEKSEAELSRVEWTDEKALAAFEFGPRLAAENACEASLEKLSDARAEMLRTTLDKRKSFAPRICLVRAWFNKEIDAHPKLGAEIEEYWGEVTRFEETEMQTTLMVNEYRKTRDRPEDPRYYRWLRHCAMRTNVTTWRPCVEAIRQLSPMQGGDMLGMIEIHLQKVPLPSPEEMSNLTETLALIARNGQPSFWKLQKNVPAQQYSIEMSLASAFYLCRLVNSPVKHDAISAADALGDIANVSSRGREEIRLERWREACRITYGGNRPDLEFVDDPILADNNVPQLEVWSGVEGVKPEYSMSAAVAKGLCKTEPERPIWFCGVKMWREPSMTVEALIKRSFIDTRYLEWTNQ